MTSADQPAPGEPLPDPTTGTGVVVSKYAGLYTREIAQRILCEIERGRTLKDTCRDDGMPAASTVRGWVARDHDGFAARFARAWEIGSPALGRPPAYSAEIAGHLLGELERGRKLADICLDDGMPGPSTVYLWVSEDQEGFAARYHRARLAGRTEMRHPSRYTPELAEWILCELAEGRSLREICRAPDMPSHSTIRRWVVENRDGFAARYHNARDFGYHAIAEEMLEIIDDGRNDWTMRQRRDGTFAAVFDHEHVRRSRLRFEGRRWLLSNALPKFYGNAREPEDKEPAPTALGEFLKLISGKTVGLPDEDQEIDADEYQKWLAKYPESGWDPFTRNFVLHHIG